MKTLFNLITGFAIGLIVTGILGLYYHPKEWAEIFREGYYKGRAAESKFNRHVMEATYYSNDFGRKFGCRVLFIPEGCHYVDSIYKIDSINFARVWQ